MKKEYLLKLAEVMDRVPSTSLAMSHWEKRKADKPETGNLGECGFAGCACGWAVHERIVPGLVFKTSTRMGLISGGGIMPYAELAFGEAENFEAAMAAFEISRKVAEYLFDPDSYPFDAYVKPEEVAFRLRHIAAGGEIEKFEDHDNSYMMPNIPSLVEKNDLVG